MLCLNCGVEEAKEKFCSRPCAASYNNRVKPKREREGREADCFNCRTKFYAVRSSKGKYCSITCSASHKRKQTRERIEAGNNVGESGLREYLIEKFGEVCCDCGIGSIWNGKPLTLHMDHKDGNSDNNHWTNVQLLCPNCHTQTPTYGAKGMGSRYKKITKRNAYLRQYKSDKIS